MTKSLWDKFKHLSQGVEEDLRSYYTGYHVPLKVPMYGILLMVRGWPETTGSIPDHADPTSAHACSWGTHTDQMLRTTLGKANALAQKVRI